MADDDESVTYIDNRPSRLMTFSEWVSLLNLRFKLFGRSDTIKKFDDSKLMMYYQNTDGDLFVFDDMDHQSYIEKLCSDKES